MHMCTGDLMAWHTSVWSDQTISRYHALFFRPSPLMHVVQRMYPSHKHALICVEVVVARTLIGGM